MAKVLKAFLEDPDQPRYGLELMRRTGMPSGSMYPLLARLEKAGWLTRGKEDIDPHTEGRSPRLYYTITGAAGASPKHFFGAEVRHAREEAGMSQVELGRLAGCDDSVVSRVEGGLDEPPTGFPEACDAAFPHMGGFFTRFYNDSHQWDGPYPRWAEEWMNAEDQAATLRIWQPLIIPGLLQTAEYAHALFLGSRPDLNDDALGRQCRS